MELKSKTKEGRCSTKNCRKAATEKHGKDLFFCAKHGAEARREYEAEGLEVEITLLEIEKEAPKTALSVVPQETVVALANEGKELVDVLAMVEGFEIVTQEDVAFAEESRALTKGDHARWDTECKKISDPAHKAWLNANAFFKPVLSTLKSIENAWTAKLKAARLKAIEEKNRLLAEAKAAEDPQEKREALVAASEAPLQTTSTSFVDRWVFDIFDVDKVPRDFMTPDLEKIGRVVSTLKDKTDIPGVRVRNDPMLRGPSK